MPFSFDSSFLVSLKKQKAVRSGESPPAFCFLLSAFYGFKNCIVTVLSSGL